MYLHEHNLVVHSFKHTIHVSSECNLNIFFRLIIIKIILPVNLIQTNAREEASQRQRTNEYIFFCFEDDF